LVSSVPVIAPPSIVMQIRSLWEKLLGLSASIRAPRGSVNVRSTYGTLTTLGPFGGAEAPRLARRR
jgi:hypothetical protein